MDDWNTILGIVKNAIKGAYLISYLIKTCHVDDQYNWSNWGHGIWFARSKTLLNVFLDTPVNDRLGVVALCCLGSIV